LSEITTPFLYYPFISIVWLNLELYSLLITTITADDKSDLMSMDRFPLRHQKHIILTWFSISYGKVYTFIIGVVSIYPWKVRIILFVKYDNSIPNIAVKYSIMMIKSFIFLTNHYIQIWYLFYNYLSWICLWSHFFRYVFWRDYLTNFIDFLLKFKTETIFG
jgi:hypothetical protein